MTDFFPKGKSDIHIVSSGSLVNALLSGPRPLLGRLPFARFSHIAPLYKALLYQCCNGDSSLSMAKETFF